MPKVVKSMQHNLLYEQERPSVVIGIDEAGRGCLAGPVVAAAVILPNPCPIRDLDDSKKLNADDRESLVLDIKTHASFGVGLVWQEDIDRINILQATFLAMSKAVKGLMVQYVRKNKRVPVCLLHIDGNKIIPPSVLKDYWPKHSKLPRQESLVHGDALEEHISAASILAKTFRDNMMNILDKRWPLYNFSKHKGYGTKEHLKALEMYGPCPLHRKTFARVLSDTKAKASKHNLQTQGNLL